MPAHSHSPSSLCPWREAIQPKKRRRPPRGGLGGVEAPSVNGVAGGRGPRPVGRAGHAVAGGEAVGELGVHQVPPPAQAEDLGALLGDEAVRVPQGLDGGPGAQVAALQAGDDATPALGPLLPPGRQDEGPGGRAGGPVDEGVAPVGRVVARRGAEGVLGVLGPPLQVRAGGVGDQLEGTPVARPPLGIAGRVEQVVDALVVLHDAAGVGVEVLRPGPARRQGLAAVLVVDEVPRKGQVPRRARLGGQAPLVEVVQPDRLVVRVGDDVADPVRPGPEEDFVRHCHFLVINRLTTRIGNPDRVGQAFNL